MICLGVESTAHTFGIGLVKKEKNKKMKVLFERKDTIKGKEGILPREAAEHHKNVAIEFFKDLLDYLNDESIKIDLVAFSAGPGLGPCLKIGEIFSKFVAFRFNLPLVPVNHCQAHIEIGKELCDLKDPVVLYVSGGNTQIIIEKEGKYWIVGETMDIAVGNAIDKLARVLSLGFPGGPKIEELAKKGKYVEMPYTVKGMDFSFSGITTEAEKLFKKGVKAEDICFSFQEHIFSMLTECVERALSFTNKNEVLLVGGVAANQRLNEMLKIMCEERECKFSSVPKEYAGDNGVMIALTGILMRKHATFDYGSVKPRQRWRIEDVKI